MKPFFLILTLVGGLSAAELPLGHPNFTPSPAQPVGWRGDGTGRYPGATPVTDWDLKTGKNIIWKTKLPYFSFSGPIVVGDRVFTTAEPDLLICVDAKTGMELWRRHNAIHMEQIEEKERARLYGVCETLLEESERWLTASTAMKEYPGKDLHDIGDVVELWAPTRDSRRGANVGSMEAWQKAVATFAAQHGLDLEKTRAMYAEIGMADKAQPTKLPKGQALLNTRCYNFTGNMPATPASDGKSVVVRAQSEAGWGYLVCYDLQGNRKWQTYAGLTGGWGCPYDSPLIIGNRVFSQANLWEPDKPANAQQVPWKEKTRLCCFDLETGKLLWSVHNPDATCSSPIPVTIDGVKMVHFASRIFLVDGTLVCNFRDLIAPSEDTPVFRGDVLFTRSAEKGGAQGNEGLKGRGAVSHALQFAWKTKGKELVYEVVWKSQIGATRAFLSGNWIYSSPLLIGDWVVVHRSAPWPGYHVQNIADKSEENTGNFLELPKEHRARKDRRPCIGVPNEDYMSAVMGGKFVFACASAYPCQFGILSAPPDAKLVSWPVLDDVVMGSPFFQGNRMYVRNRRNLYCIGDR